MISGLSGYYGVVQRQARCMYPQERQHTGRSSSGGGIPFETALAIGAGVVDPGMVVVVEKRNYGAVRKLNYLSIHERDI